VPSLTVENYVKAIWEICERQDRQVAATGKVAAALRVSPGTATSMLKTLSDSGLVTYTPYEGVRLTDAGQQLALRVIRRHRLIELFLVQTLRLTWDEVHEEAENMEHAVSDYLVDRIDEYLGHPECDPHGDPIPKSDGTLAANSHRGMLEIEDRSHFRVERILDQTPDFLRYLTECGLPPGAEGKILSARAEAATVTIEVAGTPITLSNDTAKKIMVTVVGR